MSNFILWWLVLLAGCGYFIILGYMLWACRHAYNNDSAMRREWHNGMTSKQRKLFILGLFAWPVVFIVDWWSEVQSGKDE